jgi:hypothetical protein
MSNRKPASVPQHLVGVVLAGQRSRIAVAVGWTGARDDEHDGDLAIGFWHDECSSNRAGWRDQLRRFSRRGAQYRGKKSEGRQGDDLHGPSVLADRQ